MLTPTKCHQTFLRSLLREPRVARVRLVARLADAVIANPDSSTLYVFIPDLHLISDDKLERYSYHFNEWYLFYRMLWRVQEARTTLTHEGNPLEVIQLGDLYDLWREEALVPDTIIADHTNLVGMLYRHQAGLLARILVGNHDADMIGADRFFLRLFLPTETAGAFCLALHGDWFDPLEALPDWLQRFAVSVAGPLPQPRAYPIGELKDILRREAAASDDFRNRIRLAEPAELGGLRSIGQPQASLPRIWNVQRTSQHDTMHPFLARAREVVHRFRGEANHSPAWPTVRLVTIGHSHHARISVDDTADPNHPVVLMDCGAWIERYRDSRGRVFPNCQVGVVAGNDIRIYQLDRPE
jgi:UDP-2,3-diacylglucosamine pyrophosphatase LpxH